MSAEHHDEPGAALEPCDALSYHFEMTRRRLFGVLGAGLLVLVALDEAAGAQEPGGGRRGRGPQNLGAWLHVGEDGAVSVFTGKAELGQNARTSLTQVVAEELHVVPSAVHMVMADTDLVPYDAGTFGSQTTPMMVPQLRRAAVAAREALVRLAASRWNVEPAGLRAIRGRIERPGGSESASYGELAKGLQLAEALPDVTLTPADRWRVAGRPLAKVNGRDFVSGAHRFASDLARPGMLHGQVLRPPTLGAALDSAETARAQAMSGVTVVRDGDFVGAAAPTAAAARRALDAVAARWTPAAASVAGPSLFEHLRRTAGPPQGEHAAGSMEAGLAAADHRLARTYTVAYIAHVPLEPRAAVAEWQGDRLTVWTASQRPFGVREELAQAFGMPPERVRVVIPDMGSGYGGKHTGECAVEAARLARAAGKPVKVAWTREEEFTWAYFRPAGVIDVTAGVTADGTLTAWEFHNINSGPAALRTYYEVPNQRIAHHPAASPLRQGSYRALAATANQFARETHMDELAATVKMDPLEFRLKNLRDERFRAVLQAASERFGWKGHKAGSGIGAGIAGGFEKLGYVGTCAEVEVAEASGAVKVRRVVTAFDSGPVISPDQLRNQIEGMVMMGLGGALFEAIEFADGRIQNARFSRYRLPRFSDMPQIDVVLLNRKDVTPTGAGETPMIALAPAIGAAIYAATGVRLRSLPLAPNGVRATGA